MGMELVSVLMPCRDAAAWIGPAIESALSQGGCSVEVIVVDDGSTDGSVEIARSFASGRCQVVGQEPRGASAARNRALSLAQGEFIQYLDADDLLAPEKLVRQIASLRERGRDALCWSSIDYQFDQEGEKDRRFEMARPEEASGAEFLARLWGADGNSGMIAVNQWLATRHLVERVGLWDESLSADDDGEFFARVVLAAAARLPVPEARCSYRKFRNGRNLSAAVNRHPQHRRSALKAACRKAGHLLAVDNGEAARRGVSRLLTQQIVDTYPDPAHGSGLAFLRDHGMALSDEFEAPPWFQRARTVFGWKTTRLVQNLARGGRRLGAALGRDNDAVGWYGRRIG
jgi:glycosyltransferase involved in cell wall biosynthesis